MIVNLEMRKQRSTLIRYSFNNYSVWWTENIRLSVEKKEEKGGELVLELFEMKIFNIRLFKDKGQHKVTNSYT